MSDKEVCSCQTPEIDYYSVLSLTKNCSDLDIKKAFRRLAIQFNPERQNDVDIQEIFAIISEAYEVLSDPQKRAVYDLYGEKGLKTGVLGLDGFIPPFVFHGELLRTYRNFFGTSSFSSHADLLNISENPLPFLDRPQCHGVKIKGEPLIKPLKLTLTEVFLGGIKKMKIQKLVLVGDEKNHTVSREQLLFIPIKPGLPAKTRITFPEEGDQNPSTTPGDIIFVTEDRPHEIFKRDDSNLLMSVNISLQEALTGMTITVNTIDDRILHVPITSIVSSEYQKTLSMEGLPHFQNPKKRGDLVIHFNVLFPVYLTMPSRHYIKKAFKNDHGKMGKDDTAYIHRFLLATKIRDNSADDIIFH